MGRKQIGIYLIYEYLPRPIINVADSVSFRSGPGPSNHVGTSPGLGIFFSFASQLEGRYLYIMQIPTHIKCILISK